MAVRGARAWGRIIAERLRYNRGSRTKLPTAPRGHGDCDYRDEPTVTPKTTERFVIDGPAGPLEVAINAPEVWTRCQKGGVRFANLFLQAYPFSSFAHQR